MGMYGVSDCVIRCGPGLTKQSFKDECDVNKILAKYAKSGTITHVARVVPKFGDFTNIPDYRGSLDIVNKANDAFMALPAAVRSRFENDPAKLLEFLSDPKNAEEAIKLGILEPKKEPKAPEAPVAEKAPEAPKA